MNAMRWLLAFACVFSGIPQLGAQAYPSKPVRVIISFTPGSSTDIVGRVVMAKVADYWGQPVVAENRGGAGGSIGSAAVAKAPADGYTLLINSSAHSVNPAIFASLPYDTLKDFVDIVPLTVQPNVLVVNSTSTFKTLADLVNFARSKPGSLNFGHAGIGSGTHLNTERFIAAASINVTQVPFKGTPEVVTALLSDSVHCYWSPISAGLSAIKGGKLRALAVSTARRNPSLPEVPTTGEAGVRGADSPIWFGIWGPAGMPQDVVQKVSADVRRALADPGVKEKLLALGNDTMDMAPAEFARFVREEIDTYQRVIKAAGIKPQ
ncbi:MAG: tripartite tricarboxylate transporter substrate binding protein [Candidatus Parcubacteria bacterium]|nr:tripartite tricarboxylate transporter substrate binding protein [Burkholderiales bacterium]